MESRKTFTISDLQMASFINAKGIAPVAIITKVDNPNIKEFEFPIEAMQFVEEYRKDGQVGGFSLFNSYHQLRQKIMPPKK